LSKLDLLQGFDKVGTDDPELVGIGLITPSELMSQTVLQFVLISLVAHSCYVGLPTALNHSFARRRR